MTDEGFPFQLPPDHDDAEEAGVFFQSEDIEFSLQDADVITNWINAIISREGCRLSSLNIVCCSDEYLHQINLNYLQHDTLTDIITFPYADPPDIQGDILISIDRIEDNAADLGISFSDELHRVIIHGVLHLCGYGDKTPAEKKVMTEKEDEALALFPAS